MPCTIHSGPTVIPTVEEQVQYFESKFRTFVDQAYQEVNRKMNPSVFLSRITCLPVSARSQHRSFIEEKLTNIPPPVTFENIWTKLNLYWDFLNYGLLEHVISNFGSQDLKQNMQMFMNSLHSNKQLDSVTSSRAGHAEMMDHQKTVSRRWLSK